MISSDPSTALCARGFRSRMLLATLAICGVAVAATFWWRAGRALPDPTDLASGPTADATADARAIPPEVKFASEQVVQALGIELVPVASQPVSGTIACNGRVAFNQNHYVDLHARTDGIVRHIGHDVGAKVDAHESLAVIDAPQIGDLKAAYINAVSQSKQLEWDAARLESMAADQAVPGKMLREAQTKLAQQQTTTANARQQLINLGFSPEKIDALAVSKDTSTELPLETPWPGIIVSRDAVEGAYIQRNAHLFAVADLSTMWVYLNLYESDLARVKLGQAVSFVPDGLTGHEFTGKIDWINPEVDPRTRITQVRAEVANTDGLLRANMYGRGKIIVEAPHDGLVIPADAVQDYRHTPVVFVQQTPETFAVRPITIGVKLERTWEVLSGVSLGEMVVTTGSFLLRSDLEKDKLGAAE